MRELISSQLAFRLSQREDPKERNFNYPSPLLDSAQAARVLGNNLLEPGPFLAARWGNVELAAVVEALAPSPHGLVRQQVMERLCRQAGFFPSEPELLPEFARIMLRAFSRSDVAGVWASHMNPLEDEIVREYAPEATLIPLDALSPAEAERPWTQYLEGKKVLVVHPFARSIASQYARRDALFFNPHVLPKFELITLRALQSQAGETCGHASWFEALDSMRERMDSLDYEVALVGAGAYGMPLAAHAKNRGKKAIHVGGALQLLFGIMGKRWEGRAFQDRAKYWKLEHWVRPLPEETPERFKDVENGCYW